MKKPIYERIISEAQAEAKVLSEETKAEAKRILEAGKSEIMRQNSEELNRLNESNKQRLLNHKDRQTKGLVTFKEQVRQELVVEVFNEVFTKLSLLKDKDLLDFVARLISKEKTKGDEVILVSRQNYQKYLNAFSTHKDPLQLDLLNSVAKHYHFSLSKEPTHVEEGFLLSSKEFDLIFDFKEIVSEYQKTHEQRIYNELFKDE